jgi:hypothetical protein
MTPPIERWARQAVLLERKGDFTPVASVLQDIGDLAALHRQTWKQRQRAILDSGDPTMLEGVYGGLNAYPPGGQLSVTPAATTETLLWPVATWTPIPANGMLTPEVYRIAVTISVVYAATPGTSTWTTRFGQATSSPSMGAFAAVTGTASATANATLIGDITVRNTGVAGALGTTSGTAVGFFHLIGKLSGTGAVDINQVTGHTAATFDPTAAQGFAFSVNASVATQAHRTEQIHWMSWN